MTGIITNYDSTKGKGQLTLIDYYKEFYFYERLNRSKKEKGPQIGDIVGFNLFASPPNENIGDYANISSYADNNYFAHGMSGTGRALYTGWLKANDGKWYFKEEKTRIEFELLPPYPFTEQKMTTYSNKEDEPIQVFIRPSIGQNSFKAIISQ